MNDGFLEKRIAPRIDVSHPIKYRIEDSDEEGVGYLINESTSGVLLAASRKIDVGVTVILTMDADVGMKDGHYVAECKVVRHHSIDDMIFKYGMGCLIVQKMFKI